MSKIARYAGNLLAFGSNAQGLERTVFGGTEQADDLTSQVTNAFLRGWGIVGPSENPSLEDFNAAFYTISQLISYQHQMGVPEWDAQQEYYVGSTCSYGGEIYLSLSDNNIGNKPPNSQWTLSITTKNGASKLGLGSAASRNIGSGANQVPDMSLFQSGQGWQKLPSGTIIQQGTGQAGKLGTPSTIILPVPFTDVSISQVVACYDNPMSGLAVLPAFATRVNSGGTTFDLMHSSSTTATIYCRWIAVGR